MPHGGFVLRSGEVNGMKERVEFSLALDSNPDFTASVLMAYARVNCKLFRKGVRGAKTILDIPVIELTDEDRVDFIAHTL